MPRAASLRRRSHRSVRTSRRRSWGTQSRRGWTARPPAASPAGQCLAPCRRAAAHRTQSNPAGSQTEPARLIQHAGARSVFGLWLKMYGCV
eukprot:353133-Chlamydomonas_euryale.AAC.7